VASVEVQLRVVESPLLIEVGLACSETVGRAAAGGGGGGGGGAAAGFLAQPAANATASTAVRMAPRYKELETRFIRILPQHKNPFVGPTRGFILSLAGWVMEIHRITIYSRSYTDKNGRESPTVTSKNIFQGITQP
jgi:hypothetical protein